MSPQYITLNEDVIIITKGENSTGVSNSDLLLPPGQHGNDGGGSCWQKTWLCVQGTEAATPVRRLKSKSAELDPVSI